MISGGDLRVARLAVGLKQGDLAVMTGLSEPTIRRIEAAGPGFPNMRTGTIEAVISALVNRGVQFVEDGIYTRDGVRLQALPYGATGPKMRQMRDKLGLNLARLSAVAGVSDETVRHLETVKRFSPRQAAYAGLVWSTLVAMLEQGQD